MKIGVVLPQASLGTTPDEVASYVQFIERMGYDYLSAYDHILGVDDVSRPGWRGSHNIRDPFHEIFVLYGFIAALTRKLGLITGVLVLPQRQTALVAKQAAELDMLLEGRLRLGVAVGWNNVEYEGLGMEFRTRGARIEEQVSVLRQLWSRECVSYTGRDHRLDRVGILPLPPRRDIPIWFGSGVRGGRPWDARREAIFGRIGRLGDGWVAGTMPVEVLADQHAAVMSAAEAAGRDPHQVGLQAVTPITTDRDISDVAREFEAWMGIGVTHASLRVAKVRDRHAQLDLLDQALGVLGQYQ